MTQLRVIIIGAGNQGRKRAEVAGTDVAGIVDPHVATADFKQIEEVSTDLFDAALVCTPDEPKANIIRYLLDHGKHVLVEKPMLFNTPEDYAELAALASAKNVVCYTAYNHRFEPHFVAMRDYLASGTMGKPYLCRIFYGNGTARDVRNSQWRDQGAGVLPDLGSHMLDTIDFWFGCLPEKFSLVMANRFENRAPDHVNFFAQGRLAFELEATMVSWRNHFTCDIYGENGSAHIESLCKWGPSTFIQRTRVLPSGRPTEVSKTLIQPDPTWSMEYQHFKALCQRGHFDNLLHDATIQKHLNHLSAQIG